MLYSGMFPATMAADREARLPSAALAAAAARFGTPLYVIGMAGVAAAAARLEAAFGGPWARLYSLKANDLPAVAAFLHGRGWGASVVSAGEWRHARAGGVANESVAFEGLGKTDAQLELVVHETAAGRPLRWLAIESGQEAAVLAGLARRAGLGRDGRPPLDLLLRLNPEVVPETRPQFAVGARASKFGMSDQEVLALARSGTLTGPGLRLRGIHVHVGSDLADVEAFRAAGVSAARLLAVLRTAHGGDPSWLDTIDFGGGFPLPADGAPGPEAFRDALVRGLREANLELPPRPAIEPGRYLVGAAGWLVASVLHARPGASHAQPGASHAKPGASHAQQVVLDAGMTEFIRPALYGSRHSAHALRTEDRPAPAPAARGQDTPAVPGTRDSPAGLLDTALEGPVCESTDSFGQHLLPPLHRGDLVAIGQAGAYGASFTSRYNGRPPPGEVLLWPDGSLQPCDRPALGGADWPGPALAAHRAARHPRQGPRRTVGSAPATKESLP
jgi:diaminopimelate decarboxylase